MGARITCTGNAAYGRFPVPVVAPPTMSRPRSPRSAPQATIIILARARAQPPAGDAKATHARDGTETTRRRDSVCACCVLQVLSRACVAFAPPAAGRARQNENENLWSRAKTSQTEHGRRGYNRYGEPSVPHHLHTQREHARTRAITQKEHIIHSYTCVATFDRLRGSAGSAHPASSAGSADSDCPLRNPVTA